MDMYIPVFTTKKRVVCVLLGMIWIVHKLIIKGVLCGCQHGSCFIYQSNDTGTFI